MKRAEVVHRYRKSKHHQKYIHRYRRTREYRLTGSLRARIRCALFRRKRGVKLDYSLSLLGCSTSQLAAHLEAQFLPGMTWENYGLFGWHIDHIKPISSFNLACVSGQQAAFHFTNCQPLWATDNLRKSNKWQSRANATRRVNYEKHILLL